MKNQPGNLFALGAAIMVAVDAHGQTWDLAGDFSETSNPNGAWSYGETGFTVAPTYFFNSDYDFSFWTSSGILTVGLNQSGLTEFGIPPNTATLECDNGSPDARWTAPSAGLYNIEVEIGGSTAFDGAGTGNFNAGNSGVAINGVAQPPASFINNVKAWSLTNVSLNLGDTVDAYVPQQDGNGNTATVFKVVANSIFSSNDSLSVTGTESTIHHTWNQGFTYWDLSDPDGTFPAEINLAGIKSISVTWSAPYGQMFVVNPPPAALGSLQLHFGITYAGNVSGLSIGSTACTCGLVSGTSPGFSGFATSDPNLLFSAEATITPSNAPIAFTNITVTASLSGTNTSTLNISGYQLYFVTYFGGSSSDTNDPGQLLTLQPLPGFPVLSINRFVVAGGGGTSVSSDGAYAITGTFGQAATGPIIGGGGYVEEGGFWTSPNTPGVGTAPSITAQPASMVVSNGSGGVFSVSVSGTGPFYYQWQQNGTNLTDNGVFSGAGTANLNLGASTVQNSGTNFDYRVIIVSPYGSLTSSIVTLQDVTSVKAIAAGADNSFFVRTDGSLWAMGDGDGGDLGNGTNGDVTVPELISVSGVTAVATESGALHTLFLKDDGSLWGMGEDVFGQLGDGGKLYNVVFFPEMIEASNVVAIAVGDAHSLFIKNDGSLWAMGDDAYGQLGDGTTGGIYSQAAYFPEMIEASNVVAIAAADFHSLFIMGDGSLWVMGDNENGELGNGPLPNGGNGSISTPEMIVPSNVVAVAAGIGCSFFIKSDGSLWAMGWDAWGQLGDGQTSQGVFVPELIVSNGVNAVAAGNGFSLFVETNGSLWAMGWDAWGQLGDGNQHLFETNVPEMIEASNVVRIAAGWTQSLFVKSDGALWGMGDNTYGELGVGTNETGTFLPQSLVPQVFTTAFTAAPETGQPPLAVQFSGPSADNYSNPVISWLWNFADGSTSTNQNPNHTYIRNGTFQVTLAVTNISGTAINGSGPAISVGPLPQITSQPQSVLLSVGTTTSLTGEYSGPLPFTYQWQLNGTNVSSGSTLFGATNGSLYFGPASAAEGGNYTVIVSNVYGSVTSSIATVTVLFPNYSVFQLPSTGYATGINNNGEVVGSAPDEGGQTPFVYSNGHLTFIGGGDVGQAYAINNNGQIVGEHDNPEFDPNAFLYGNGILSAVGVPTNYSVATAINNTGSIVGVIGPSNFPIQTHGFRFANGTMEDLNVLAATTGISSATGINDSGAIVGTETNRHSFLFANGQLTDLGLLPAGTFCQANAINNSGETVGQADTIISTSSYTHAFSYLAGTITDLAPGQAAYYAANALNNSGQIVGTMSDDAFVYNGGVMFDLNNLVVPNAMANPYLAEAVGINDLGQIVVNSNPAEGMYILTPTYQPQFEATALNGGELQLTWSALQAFPPVGYQIQYATDLAASNWANLGLPVCGTNGTLSTNVTFNPSAQGFYRILVVQ